MYSTPYAWLSSALHLILRLYWFFFVYSVIIEFSPIRDAENVAIEVEFRWKIYFLTGKIVAIRKAMHDFTTAQRQFKSRERRKGVDRDSRSGSPTTTMKKSLGDCLIYSIFTRKFMYWTPFNNTIQREKKLL